MSEQGASGMKLCAVEDCQRPVKGSRGWCGMHLERWRRWGDPTETRVQRRGQCSVDGCGLPHEARGLCNVHYMRARRVEARKPSPSLADRLDRLIDKSAGPDACWPWVGRRTRRGYGLTAIQAEGRTIRTGAHRARYIAEHGPIPEGLFVLHACDNPPCCNPAHLRAGTHLENMADRRERGAGYAIGNDAPTAVQIAPETVAAIRAAYMPHVKGRGQHALAQRFGLSRTTVRRIVTETDRWGNTA